MLRFDPGDGRMHTSRMFQAWEGGGDYNVARGLRRCFGLRTAIITAFADNNIGRLVEDLILQGGVDSFASGLIYGLMTTGDPQQAVEYGAAHGALAMTTPGDTTMARLAEVYTALERIKKPSRCSRYGTFIRC